MTAGALRPPTLAPTGADQASRLRALMEAMSAPPAPAAADEPSAHAPTPAPPRILPPHPRAARLVAIGSGKGGVGKSSLAVNLAIAVARQRLRVTLLDADLGTANADVLCGVMPRNRLEHVLRHDSESRPSLADIAIDAPGGFRLVPGTAGIARLADLSPHDRAAMIDSLDELEAGADLVLIDTAAGVGSSVTSFLLAADLSLIVTTPEPTAIADAYALIKCLATVPESDGGGRSASEWGGRGEPWDRGGRLPSLRLVVNQARDQDEAASVHARISGVSERFLGLTIPLAGWIAQDLRVSQAVRSRRPLLLEHEASPAGRAITDLGGFITRNLGIEPPPRPAAAAFSGRRSLFARLFRT
ncbi:MAG: AAA family ATPase [Phycisphaeraceae bacterium]|nr:AAA family ATPase [Phycisphaeraceae bacterium]